MDTLYRTLKKYSVAWHNCLKCDIKAYRNSANISETQKIDVSVSREFSLHY